MSKNMPGTCSKHWLTLPPPPRSRLLPAAPAAPPPFATEPAAAVATVVDSLPPSALLPVFPLLRNRRIPSPYLGRQNMNGEMCSCAGARYKNRGNETASTKLRSKCMQFAVGASTCAQQCTDATEHSTFSPETPGQAARGRTNATSHLLGFPRKYIIRSLCSVKFTVCLTLYSRKNTP